MKVKKSKRSVAPLTPFWIPLTAGILIFSIAFGLLTIRDRQYLQSVLHDTLTFMKNRIESYDHYQSADKTKSLMRLADKVEALNTELKLMESYDVQSLDSFARQQRLTGVLLLDYLIGAMRRAGKMPEKPYFLKTIVTTEMARKVAESNDVTCCDTFTGFKFMAEKKNALEAAGEGHVIMSYEESYGYMLGDYVRDKDAVTASLLITEMAAWYAAKGMTLYDALQALYKKYGWYGEKTHNLIMPGLDGLEKMAALMKRLRTAPPANIAGADVVVRKDYQDGSAVDCAAGKVGRMELSGSNVLRYELADGTTILVRPSGTEPKIKVYILTKGVDAAERDANIEKYSAWVKTLTE